MNVVVSCSDAVDTGAVIDLYRANGWSSANRPGALLAALGNSHSLVAARADQRLSRGL
jgi:hypothetical protein